MSGESFYTSRRTTLPKNCKQKSKTSSIYCRYDRTKHIDSDFRLREKFRQKKEKRSIDEKLKTVKGLGESDDFDDINAWIEHSRDKEKSKMEAQKRAKMLEEMDAEYTKPDARKVNRSNYTEKNLKGLKVGHSMDSFGDGKTVILTLKDHEVLAEDGDELINVNMVDDERYKKVN